MLFARVIMVEVQKSNSCPSQRVHVGTMLDYIGAVIPQCVLAGREHSLLFSLKLFNLTTFVSVFRFFTPPVGARQYAGPPVLNDSASTPTGWLASSFSKELNLMTVLCRAYPHDHKSLMGYDNETKVHNNNNND